MSSKNAKKKDAADKYLERKLKSIDAIETRMLSLLTDYKADLQALREENLSLTREVRFLRNQATYDINQLQTQTAIIGKMSGMTPGELELFIETLYESVRADKRKQVALEKLLALSNLFPNP